MYHASYSPFLPKREHSHIVRKIVLGGLYWRLSNKTIGLWYTHRNVDLKLRIGALFAHHIFTASSESFKLKSSKVHVVGHGLDLNRIIKGVGQKKDTSVATILHIGRITPIKNINTIIEAFNILSKTLSQPLRLVFVGGLSTQEDTYYFERIKKLVEVRELSKKVTFAGGMPYEKMLTYLGSADVAVNMLPTGGVDKVVLEAMVARVPVLSSNETFKEYFGEYSKDLLVTFHDADDLAKKMKKVLELDAPEYDRMTADLKKYVESRASLKQLIERIVRTLALKQ